MVFDFYILDQIHIQMDLFFLDFYIFFLIILNLKLILKIKLSKLILLNNKLI